jgi:hypothetical protein
MTDMKIFLAVSVFMRSVKLEEERLRHHRTKQISVGRSQISGKQNMRK